MVAFKGRSILKQYMLNPKSGDLNIGIDAVLQASFMISMYTKVQVQG